MEPGAPTAWPGDGSNLPIAPRPPAPRATILLAIAGTITGIALLLLGAVFTFGESFTADEVDCGASALDLANGRAIASGEPAFQRECTQAGRDDVTVGLALGAVGLAITLRSLWTPRLAVRTDLDLARMVRNRRWGPARHQSATARAGAWSVAITAPVSLVLAPIEPVALMAGALAIAVAVTWAYSSGPTIEARDDGLAHRTRWWRWHRHLWRDIEHVLAGPEGIELWMREDAALTGVLPHGWSARRGQFADRAAAAIGSLVLERSGRPADQLGLVIGAVPPDEVDPDPTVGDTSWLEALAEIRRHERYEHNRTAVIAIAVLGIGFLVMAFVFR